MESPANIEPLTCLRFFAATAPGGHRRAAAGGKGQYRGRVLLCALRRHPLPCLVAAPRGRPVQTGRRHLGADRTDLAAAPRHLGRLEPSFLVDLGRVVRPPDLRGVRAGRHNAAAGPRRGERPVAARQPLCRLRVIRRFAPDQGDHRLRRTANHSVIRTLLRALSSLARQRGGSPQSARERRIFRRQRARLCPIWGA